MDASPQNSAQSIAELVNFLFSRREAILSNLRTACERDPALSSIRSLSREEFNNLLPIVLNNLERRLLGQPEEADPLLTASAHGLHRFQKAHALSEVLRELNHLLAVLLDDVRLFQQVYPQVDAGLVMHAVQHITQLMGQTINGSAAKYDELQRLEAASRAGNLQRALDQMNELLRQRGEILRTSTHDLRGGLSIIQSAAMLLNLELTDETERAKYADMLNRNLANVRTVLSDLMDLSRIEAGQEPLNVQAFDAAGLLRELVESAQPLAAERGLLLRADGTPSLPVHTDREKVYRIAQNLLLNALNYTPSGQVSVAWLRDNDSRWAFSVQDSGPGLPDNLMQVFAQQLKPTVEATSVMGPDQTQPGQVLPNAEQEVPSPDDLAQRTVQSRQGEGVGLQIVKRLCEMLEASLEVETRPGRGTLFRVRLLVEQRRKSFISEK